VLYFFYPQIIGYLLGVNSDLSFLTMAEASHMYDVKFLLFRGMIFSAGSIGLLLIYNSITKITVKTIRNSFYISLLLIALLVPFSFVFEKFHAIFFPQGNWQFPTDSWLITHFSQTFFMLVALIWIGGTTLTLWLLSKKIKK
jgi:uncharacterized membrane protein